MILLTTQFGGKFHVFFRVSTWLLYALCMQFLEFPATFLTSLANFCRLVRSERTQNIAALQQKSKNFIAYRFLVAFYSIHKSLHGKALCNHRKPISVSGLGVTLIINHWKSDTFTSSGSKKNEIVYTMISWIFIRVPGSHLFTFSKIVNRYQIEFNAF